MVLMKLLENNVIQLMMIKLVFISFFLLSFNILQEETNDYIIAKKLLLEFEQVSQGKLVLNEIGSTNILVDFLNKEIERSQEEIHYRPVNKFLKNHINHSELEYFNLQSSIISWEKDILSTPNLILKKDLDLNNYCQISLCYISKPVYTINHDFALVYYEFNNQKLIYVFKNIDGMWCKHETIGKWFFS